MLAEDAEPDYLPSLSICNFVPVAGFVDVAGDHPNARDIDCIAYLGITRVTSATTFSPDETVTREQMALFLTRLAPFFDVYPSETPQRVAFTDIGHLSAVSQRAIAQLADPSLEITKGTSATTFSPSIPVRRDHMALFLWRLMNRYVPTQPLSYGPFDVWDNRKAAHIGTPFTDVTEYVEGVRGSPSVSDAITELWEMGVVSGQTPTTYSPSAVMTRASMAEFMTNALRHGLSNHRIVHGARYIAEGWCSGGLSVGRLDEFLDDPIISDRHPYALDILKLLAIRTSQTIEGCAIAAGQLERLLSPSLTGHSTPSGGTENPATDQRDSTTTTTTTTASPASQGPSTALLAGIRIAPENCSGSDRANYNPIPGGINWGNMGYLTQRTLTDRDIDHVVALHEAWCSEARDPAIGSDLANLRASDPSTNRGKGGRDPLEWWNTNGKTSPRKVEYPGWCDYLNIHVEIKTKYDATMEQAEHDFVKKQLQGCETNGNPPPTTTTTTTVPATSDCPYTSTAGNPCAAVPALGNQLNDVNCSDIPNRYKPLTVTGTDHDRLDGNKDGKACNP